METDYIVAAVSAGIVGGVVVIAARSITRYYRDDREAEIKAANPPAGSGHSCAVCADRDEQRAANGGQLDTGRCNCPPGRAAQGIHDVGCVGLSNPRPSTDTAVPARGLYAPRPSWAEAADSRLVDSDAVATDLLNALQNAREDATRPAEPPEPSEPASGAPEASQSYGGVDEETPEYVNGPPEDER